VTRYDLNINLIKKFSNIFQAKGDARQDKASLENDLSHTVGKAGPFAISGSGAVSKDSSDRTEGSWNQTVGSAKEAVGNL
jgi:hypothetical protein